MLELVGLEPFIDASAPIALPLKENIAYTNTPLRSLKKESFMAKVFY